MNKILVAITLVIMSFTAHAGNRGHGNQGGVALAGAQAEATAPTNVSTGLDVNNRRAFPTGTAIGAASSNTTAGWRYLDSHSTSVLFFARSRTQMKFDVVSFVASEPTEFERNAACFAEQGYRDYREYEASIYVDVAPCPKLLK